MTSGHQLSPPSVGAPAELGAPFNAEDVLRSLPRLGWTVVAYGERYSPDLLVAYHRIEEGTYVDVFATHGPGQCGAYRARIWPHLDPVDVFGVTWSVVGDVSTVLRALLNMGPVERGSPDCDMPAELRALLPNPTQRHRTIRPPQ